MEKERVKIADIAQELGVSTATVSNVIHGKTKKVSAKTVKRVQKMLEEKEYIPSMAGILLAQNSSKIIGVIVNDHEKYEGHVFEDGFISASINNLSRQIDEHGYFMMVKATKDKEEISRFASMWNMVGVVLIGFCEHDYQKLRDSMHIPFVVYDGYFENGEGIVNIVIDHYDGGVQIGEYYKKSGHSKVLCISDNDICMDYERYCGLKSVLPESELLVVPMKKQERELFYKENIDYIMSYTAVFAVSDYYAIDFIRFICLQGYEAPTDISVAGFDNSYLSSQVQPKLTTIGQDHYMRAMMAIELLEKLKRGETAERKYVIPVKLIERESTGSI